MTLVVTQEILEKLDCCSSGLVTFGERINGRTSMEYQEFLELAFEMEKSKPEDRYVFFTLGMKKDPRFYLMQGAFTMSDKFQVFNHKLGTHEVFESEVDARARREQLINEFMQENLHIFSINREILVNENKDTMWVPITDLGMPL